jgi:hypothetical protein
MSEGEIEVNLIFILDTKIYKFRKHRLYQLETTS